MTFHSTHSTQSTARQKDRLDIHDQKGPGLCCVDTPKRIHALAWEKYGLAHNGRGHSSREIKGILVSQEGGRGVFFPWASFTFPGAWSEERTPLFFFCWKVDLIFKSTDGNITHVSSEGYSPAECFVEFVAGGEFPETSWIDGLSRCRANGNQAEVERAGSVV